MHDVAWDLLSLWPAKETSPTFSRPPPSHPHSFLQNCCTLPASLPLQEGRGNNIRISLKKICWVARAVLVPGSSLTHHVEALLLPLLELLPQFVHLCLKHAQIVLLLLELIRLPVVNRLIGGAAAGGRRGEKGEKGGKERRGRESNGQLVGGRPSVTKTGHTKLHEATRSYTKLHSRLTRARRRPP